ncbi:MAG: hypothetical protein KDK07_15800 [Bauldia sp.]|nr:hypothetical protein [Bauldia sp.]
MGDRIVAIEVAPFAMRFREPFVMAIGRVDVSQHLLVRVVTASGHVGLGEAAFENGPIFSEETPASATNVVRNHIAPLLAGQETGDLESHAARMDQTVKGNPFAKSAVEMAIADARARQLGVPVYALLGGMVRPVHEDACHIATMDIDCEAEKAAVRSAAGCRLFKLKVGAVDPAIDVRRVAAMRERLGEGVRIGIDANGAWTVRQAKRLLRDMEPFALDFIEQPVPGGDLPGMAELRRCTSVPIMADESVFTPADALRVVEARAADIISIKISKAGGLLNAKRIAAIADAAGLSCYVGNMAEGGIGAAAGLHFAASTRSVDFGCELSVSDYLDGDDVVAEAFVAEEGRLRVPGGPGLGVTLRAGAADNGADAAAR